MKIFVTGGSGFVGGHTIEALLSLGHEVVALARSDRSSTIVEDYGAMAVRGELGAITTGMLEGVDAVVHAAAFVEEWGTREQFQKTNVDGTRQLIEAAKSASVARFVHVSTEATIFSGQDLNHVDESSPFPTQHRYLYSESKADAEQVVIDANGPNFATIALRPSLIWGPRDQTVLPTIIEMVETGRFRWIGDGNYDRSTTHVLNLVQAIVSALTNGRGGEAYFVADDGDVTLREFLERYAATKGTTMPKKSIPAWVARNSGAFFECTWRALNLKSTPPIHKFIADVLSSNVTVDTSKAKDELKYVPEWDLDRGMTELTIS